VLDEVQEEYDDKARECELYLCTEKVGSLQRASERLRAVGIRVIEFLTSERYAHHWAVLAAYIGRLDVKYRLYELTTDGWIIKSTVQNVRIRNGDSAWSCLALGSAFVSPRTLFDVAKTNALNNERYGFLENNCQMWVKHFLEQSRALRQEAVDTIDIGLAELPRMARDAIHSASRSLSASGKK
jgi:hypothetical protein